MSGIPFHIKLLGTLGIVKVSQVKKHTPIESGVMPKGLDTLPREPKPKPAKKTISISKLLGIGLLGIMVISLVYVNVVPFNTQGKTATPQHTIIPDSEIISKYPQLADLSRALKSGEIHTNDLSKSMQNVVERYKLYP